MKAVRVLIKGRVQGVFYRAWTVAEAARLGVDGWVRNLRSGEVEAHFCGADDRVDALIAACWHGPAAARVDDITLYDAEATGETGFRQRPTE